MKRKLFIIVLLLILITGCSKKTTVKEATSTYLNNYINLDETVLLQLNNQANRYYKDEIIKNKYIDLLKKQYSNLEYNIVKEKYDGEFAYATVDIKVFDLYEAQKRAVENIESFLLEDGTYDEIKFTLYKLDLMLETNKKINSTITIKLLRNDDNWEVLQLSNENLEKLHGIYNYEE